MTAVASNVGRRYAKALLEIGVEEGTLNALVDEMTRIAQTYEESEELRRALDNPVVGLEPKRAIAMELIEKLGLGSTARYTLSLLLERRRVKILPDIAMALREMNDARRGVVRAEVRTAIRLSDSYYEKLRQKLEQMTGKRVTLETREDPTLLGGVVTRIGDTVIDGSVRARLQELKSSLMSATSPV